MDKGEQLRGYGAARRAVIRRLSRQGTGSVLDSALAWAGQRCMKGNACRADALAMPPLPTSGVCSLARNSALIQVNPPLPSIRDSIMLQNPIHLRLERLESWQHVTFMACLCERMYPNYAMFCKQTEFGDGQIYRRILDSIWEN